MSLFGGKSGTEETASPKSSFFSRMKQAVSRTRESLSSKIEDVVALTRTVDESTLQALESALLSSDLGIQTTTEILAALRDRARHQAIEGGEELRTLLKQQLRAILEAPISNNPNSLPSPSDPAVTFLVGVNGTGKTTSAGKLAAWSRAQNRTVLLCAADTYRAAAIEQLEIWADRSGVEMIKTRHGGDPVGRPLRRHQRRQSPAISTICTSTPLAASTPNPASWTSSTKCAAPPPSSSPARPIEVLLVMDATTGQNGLQQARQFTQSAGVTGIVLTKLDGTAKGGIAVAIARELYLPVRFVGVGEQMTDLLEFSPAEFVDSLLE